MTVGEILITTRAPFALIAASALLLLAGCSAGGAPSSTADSAAPSGAGSATPGGSSPDAAADGGQSKADACQIIIASFNDVASTSQSIDTSDPEGTRAAFAALTEKVQSDFAQITNEEIAPAAQKAGAQLDAYSAFLESFIADPTKASELGPQVSALQESFTEAGTACQG
jgi:hypothetical protein